MDYSENYKKYKKQETDFGKLISKYGKVIPSTQNEDINEHWDIKLEVKFDVKAIKKIKHSDDDTNENYHYVELRNVNGKHGWLYGDADLFAFETEDYYVLVPKIILQSFIAQKCKSKEVCETPTLYKLYTRKGRQDIITLVKTIDLMRHAEVILDKTTEN